MSPRLGHQRGMDAERLAIADATNQLIVRILAGVAAGSLRLPRRPA